MKNPVFESKWLALYLVGAFALVTGLFMLFGFSFSAAVLAAVAVVCPALLIWLYLAPGRGGKHRHDAPSQG